MKLNQRGATAVEVQYSGAGTWPYLAVLVDGEIRATIDKPAQAKQLRTLCDRMIRDFEKSKNSGRQKKHAADLKREKKDGAGNNS